MDGGDGGSHFFPARQIGLGGRGDPQGDRRLADRDPNDGVAAPTNQIRQHLLQIALPDAKTFDPVMADHLAFGPQSDGDRRRDARVPHFPHFGRNARQAKNAGWVASKTGNGQVDARGGAMGIRHDPAALRKQRLNAVRLRHHALPALEQRSNVLQRRRIQLQRHSSGLGDGFSSQVVRSWPQSARGDNQVGPLDCRPKHANIGGQVVAHRRVVSRRDP